MYIVFKLRRGGMVCREAKVRGWEDGDSPPVLGKRRILPPSLAGKIRHYSSQYAPLTAVRELFREKSGGGGKEKVERDTVESVN